MKQVLSGSDGIVVGDVPAPVAREGFVVVKNEFSLISSGTELAGLSNSGAQIKRVLFDRRILKRAIRKIKTIGMAGTMNLAKTKFSSLTDLGYSCAGIVIETHGNVDGIRVGDRVACAGAGYASHAEYVAVPKNLTVKIPRNTGFDEAAFTTLGAIALQGVRRTRPEVGETIAVLGLGLIGQLTAQILKANGCKVIGVDIDRRKVEKARELGLDVGLCGQDTTAEIIRRTDGVGADAVILCAATSSSELINQSMKMCRRKGRVVIVGAVGLNLERDDFYRKELDVLISTSYGPGRYDSQYEEGGIDYPIGYVRWTEKRNMHAFLELLLCAKVRVKPLISGVFAVDKAKDAYESLKTKQNAFGVLIRYSPKKVKKTERTVAYLPKHNKKGRINIAVIGCGNFSKAVHLPNIQKIDGFNLRAVSSMKSSNAMNTAKIYHAEYATTDYHEILEDKRVDAVVIATRHNLHAKIAIDAANHGKHILVEKPMVVDKKDIAKIVKAVEKNKVCYSVGFNRRYAPMSASLKEFLEADKPIVASYRVNAGFIPRENWVNDPIEGGGRIIGEGCHFFDYLNWLTGSKATDFHAIDLNSGMYYDCDNLICTIKYENGSIAELNYNTVGSNKTGKEYIEVFQGGKSAIMEDYTRLTLNDKTTSAIQDKGHYNELIEFAKKIRGEESNLLDLYEAVSATELTFKAIESIRKGI